MPTCNSCGNQTAFDHVVNGTETRLYDPDSGSLEEIERDSLETQSIECAECGSSDIARE